VLFFTMTTAAYGTELYKTDGTGAGTVLVKDIRPGPQSSGIASPLLAGASLFFLADDGTAGVELWRSDGTAAGTALVKDIAAGPFPGAVSRLSRAGTGERVVFAANDLVSGVEAWRSDGSAARTLLVNDLAPGSASSNPEQLTTVGSKVFFTAYTPATGVELYVMPLAATGAPLAENLGLGCPGAGGQRPRMEAAGQPTLGNAAFAVAARPCQPSAPCAFGLSASSVPFPLLGCTLYLGLPLVTIGTSTNAAGAATLPLGVPSNPALLGGEIFFQCFVADAAAAEGFAFSDCLHVVIGD
jgi:ELWxxDGT repeat protein